MAEVDLVAERRERTGKKRAKEIRADGMVPGVYYAPGEEALNIKIESKNLHDTIATSRHIVNLDLGGKRIRKCIIKEVQYDPISDIAIHVDLMGIKMDKELDIATSIHLTGIPVGVKVSGGVQQQSLREVIIRALPDNIPDFIEVDITDLDIGDSIHVGELEVKDAEVLTDADITVVSVVMPTKVIEEVEVEEEELLEGEEGEVTEAEAEEPEKDAGTQPGE